VAATPARSGSEAQVPKQDVGLELYYNGSWHDVVTDDKVLADAPITIRRGLGDESGGWPRPAQITARLDNAADKYRTSNPESPLYGLAGRNTPMRASVGGTVRGIVEASSWTADQTPDFRQTPRRGVAWVDVAGGGLLQRIGQWTQPLRSPFRQYNETITTSVGYFPGEQDRGSSSLLTVTPGLGGTPTFSRIAADSQYRPASSAPLLDVPENADIGARFLPGPAGGTAGWQLSWVARYAPLDSGGNHIMTWKTANGLVYSLFLNPTPGQIELVVQDALASTLLDSSSTYSGYDWTQWTLLSIDAKYSAGTTTVWINWTNEDGSASGFANPSFTAIPSSLQFFDATSFASGFAGVPVGSTIGHIIGTSASSVTGPDDLFGTDRRTAWSGYRGELAANRFARLIDQELGTGHYYVSAGYASSMPMGPQPVASLSDLIKECITTDDAIVYDYSPDLRLQFLCRVDRYNQTPALELTPSDLTVLPREVNDDKGTGNVVTASQRNGGDWTAQDDTGPLGTQAPPDGLGEVKKTIDVNLDDPDAGLPQVANWWLRKGTVDLPRFPQLTIDLNAKPGLIGDVEAVQPGSVITLTGFRENVIRLYVLGWTETIGTHTRTITFICAPDQQYDVGTYDDGRRYGSASTTLKTGVNSTATSITFRTTNPSSLWSTTAEPYDVFVSGERITVTSMGSASLVSGAYDQAATVTRSVNGVTKSLTAGDSIRIATPGRWAL
jgi:hypothetical protein